MMSGAPAARHRLRGVQRLRIRVLWTAVAVIAALVLFTAPLSRETGRLVPALMTAAGLVLIYVAVLGRGWSTLYIGGRKSAEVVTTGPYSICRNPLYLFSFAGALGAGLLTGSLVIALACLATAMAVFHLTIREEEAFLSETFGAAYADYAARVPRLWPALRLHDGGGEVTVQPARLWATLRDASLFFAAWPACALVAALQEAGVLPVLARIW